MMLDPIEEKIRPFLTRNNTEKQAYSEIGQDESEDANHGQPPSSNHRRLRWRIVTTAAASFILGILTMASLYAIISRPAPETRPNRNLPAIREGSDAETGLPLSWSHGDCGNSPEDAAGLGCRYSIVLHAWLPRDCLADEDVEDEKLMYEGGREWPYWLDDGTNLTLHQLRSGRHDHFATTFDWHVTHCMYVWKRVHRSMNDGTRKIDSYAANIHHTHHCVRMIGGGGGGGGMKDSGTKIFVKYPVCA